MDVPTGRRATAEAAKTLDLPAMVEPVGHLVKEMSGGVRWVAASKWIRLEALSIMLKRFEKLQATRRELDRDTDGWSRYESRT